MRTAELSQRERRKRISRERRARPTRQELENAVAFVDVTRGLSLAELTREHARSVLEWAQGRKHLAAETLGIDVRTLNKLVR